MSHLALTFDRMEFWAQRTVSPIDGREGWTVVDERYAEQARVGEWLRVLVDGEGRSVGTARAYAGRIALYLTWAATAGVDELCPTVEQLAGFARWLERTPSRKHRQGRDRRLAASQPGVLTMTPARSAGTVDGILIAVVEFARFAASRGWTDAAAAGALSLRERLRFPPARWDRGERAGRPVVERRRVRRRRVERAPATLSREQVGALVDACSNVRDRLVVEALYATGLRVAELCGLRLADMHLVPSASHLGCQVAGAHLHVIRREDNENRALAKSVYPRVMPVTRGLVWLHDAYRAERDAVPEAAESDYLLVNLWRPRWAGRCRRTRWSSCSCACRPGPVSGPARICCATPLPPRWPSRPRTRRWSRSFWGTPRWPRRMCTCIPAGMTCEPR